MQLARAGRIAAILAAAALSAGAVAAPDAAEIMKKATDAMKGAKTYDASWLVTVSLGEMGSMTMNMEMKTASDGRSYMKMTSAGPGTGMMAMAAGMAAMTTVSDGKTVMMYMPAMNTYSKMDQPKDHNPAASRILGGADREGAKYDLVGVEKVGTNNCHVIKITMPKAAAGQPEGMKMDMTAYVDTATSRLRQMKMNMTMTGGPMGGGAGGAGMKIATTMLVKSEKFDTVIPDSLFVFTPPADAKEMKGGLGGMMGGMMGGMTGGPAGGAKPKPQN